MTCCHFEGFLAARPVSRGGFSFRWDFPVSMKVKSKKTILGVCDSQNKSINKSGGRRCLQMFPLSRTEAKSLRRIRRETPDYNVGHDFSTFLTLCLSSNPHPHSHCAARVGIFAITIMIGLSLKTFPECRGKPKLLAQATSNLTFR